jgi:hypothetical protein
VNFEITEVDKHSIDLDTNQQVIDHLADILNEYLRNHPRITLNGLSKKCQVSEPTIRRIAKKQIKTLPNLSTVLDLLTTISKKREVAEIIKLYPGPVSDFISESLPQAVNQGSEFSQKINSHLKEPIKYLIFKLSLNTTGVTDDKVKQLFGDLGLNDLKYLIKHELIELRGRAFFAKIENFTTAHEDFVDQFKASANFIKPHTFQSRMPINPLFLNASESVSIETYKEIIKIQRMALKKISNIISSDESKGPIPLLFLCAIDTLDKDSALKISTNLEKN